MSLKKTQTNKTQNHKKPQTNKKTPNKQKTQTNKTEPTKQKIPQTRNQIPQNAVCFSHKSSYAQAFPKKQKCKRMWYFKVSNLLCCGELLFQRVLKKHNTVHREQGYY